MAGQFSQETNLEMEVSMQKFTGRHAQDQLSGGHEGRLDGEKPGSDKDNSRSLSWSQSQGDHAVILHWSKGVVRAFLSQSFHVGCPQENSVILGWSRVTWLCPSPQQLEWVLQSQQCWAGSWIWMAQHSLLHVVDKAPSIWPCLPVTYPLTTHYLLATLPSETLYLLSSCPDCTRPGPLWGWLPFVQVLDRSSQARTSSLTTLFKVPLIPQLLVATHVILLVSSIVLIIKWYYLFAYLFNCSLKVSWGQGLCCSSSALFQKRDKNIVGAMNEWMNKWTMHSKLELFLHFHVCWDMTSSGRST